MPDYPGLIHALLSTKYLADARAKTYLTDEQAAGIRALGFETATAGWWDVPPLPPELVLSDQRLEHLCLKALSYVAGGLKATIEALRSFVGCPPISCLRFNGEHELGCAVRRRKVCALGGFIRLILRFDLKPSADERSPNEQLVTDTSEVSSSPKSFKYAFLKANVVPDDLKAVGQRHIRRYDVVLCNQVATVFVRRLTAHQLFRVSLPLCNLMPASGWL